MQVWLNLKENNRISYRKVAESKNFNFVCFLNSTFTRSLHEGDWHHFPDMSTFFSVFKKPIRRGFFLAPRGIYVSLTAVVWKRNSSDSWDYKLKLIQMESQNTLSELTVHYIIIFISFTSQNAFFISWSACSPGVPGGRGVSSPRHHFRLRHWWFPSRPRYGRGWHYHRYLHVSPSSHTPYCDNY